LILTWNDHTVNKEYTCVCCVCVCMGMYAIDWCTYFTWEAFYILESNMYRLEIFKECFKSSGIWCCVTGWVVPNTLNGYNTFILKVRQLKEKAWPAWSWRWRQSDQKVLAHSTASRATKPIFHNTAVRTSNPTCYLFQFCVLHVHI
jgi:hypothetical protein